MTIRESDATARSGDSLDRLVKHLLNSSTGITEGEPDAGVDDRYQAAVVADFEELIDVVLSIASKFGFDEDAPRLDQSELLSVPMEIDKTRSASIEMLDAILKSLEYRWGIADALSPLRFLKSALQDLVDGRSPPLFLTRSQSRRGPRGALDSEFLSHVRYLSALVVEIDKEQGGSLGQAADSWAKDLALKEIRHPYDRKLISASMIESWHRDLMRNDHFCERVLGFRQLEAWPDDSASAAAFRRRTKRFLTNMYRRMQEVG